MSAVEIKAEITSYLEKVRDETFLKVVHSMLDTYLKEQEKEDPILGYDADGKPLYAREAKEIFRAELEGVKHGEYMTIEEFEKESKKW
jgi:hypothetical protein